MWLVASGANAVRAAAAAAAGRFRCPWMMRHSTMHHHQDVWKEHVLSCLFVYGWWVPSFVVCVRKSLSVRRRSSMCNYCIRETNNITVSSPTLPINFLLISKCDPRKKYPINRQQIVYFLVTVLVLLSGNKYTRTLHCISYL